MDEFKEWLHNSLPLQGQAEKVGRGKIRFFIRIQSKRVTVNRTQPTGIWILGRIALWTALAFFACVSIWLLCSTQGKSVVRELQSRNPQEMIRYAQRRLEGHPTVQATAGRLLTMFQAHLERTPPSGLSDLGKGQQKALHLPKVTHQRDWLVSSPQDLRRALQEATPGTRIVITPGLYPFQSKLSLGMDGTKAAPIALVALQPGSVWLTFEHIDGIMVNRPYWVFENLNIRGICSNHDICEHAFHVTGRGSNTTIRNNYLVDFNAHIKVNGFSGNWPDDGTFSHNTLTLTKPRATANPVVAFDLVGANNWLVIDNLVTNIVKSRGTKVSYGMYMKGAGRNGHFERNLVVCTTNAISRPGIRVGISFGGGNTGQQYCRDQRCEREHINGTILNNVVAHCNDSGIDINRSAPVLVAHNTLINTSGITLRQQPAQALLVGNLYDGKALARDGTTFKEIPSPTIAASQALVEADALNLDWSAEPTRIERHHRASQDFYMAPRAEKTALGSIEVADSITP